MNKVAKLVGSMNKKDYFQSKRNFLRWLEVVVTFCYKLEGNFVKYSNDKFLV